MHIIQTAKYFQSDFPSEQKKNEQATYKNDEESLLFYDDVLRAIFIQKNIRVAKRNSKIHNLQIAGETL